MQGSVSVPLETIPIQHLPHFPSVDIEALQQGSLPTLVPLVVFSKIQFLSSIQAHLHNSHPIVREEVLHYILCDARRRFFVFEVTRDRALPSLPRGTVFLLIQLTGLHEPCSGSSHLQLLYEGI